MKSISITLLCCATALGCALILANRYRAKESWREAPLISAGGLELREVGQRIFVVNKSEGTIWRYFAARDEKGNLTQEGFSQLGFVPMPPSRVVDFNPVWLVTPTPTPARK